MKQTTQMPQNSTPPITPPTIAPTGGDDAVDCGGVVDGDSVGGRSVPFGNSICGTRDFSTGLAQPWYGSID